MSVMRGAVIGDVLAALLSKAGFDVTREYFINDAGVQIDVLTRSAVHRFKQALGEDVGEIPDGLYPGEYLIPVGKDLAALEDDVISAAITDGDTSLVRDFVIDAMMTDSRGFVSARHIARCFYIRAVAS